MTRQANFRRHLIAGAFAALWAIAPQAHAGQAEFQPMLEAAEQRPQGLIVTYRDGAAATDLKGSAASAPARA